MHPSPRAETSKSLVPSLRFCILVLLRGADIGRNDSRAVRRTVETNPLGGCNCQAVRLCPLPNIQRNGLVLDPAENRLFNDCVSRPERPLSVRPCQELSFRSARDVPSKGSSY